MLKTLKNSTYIRIGQVVLPKLFFFYIFCLDLMSETKDMKSIGKKIHQKVYRIIYKNFHNANYSAEDLKNLINRILSWLYWVYSIICLLFFPTWLPLRWLSKLQNQDKLYSREKLNFLRYKKFRLILVIESTDRSSLVISKSWTDGNNFVWKLPQLFNIF